MEIHKFCRVVQKYLVFLFKNVIIIFVSPTVVAVEAIFNSIRTKNKH